jgi:hypothetical protein
MRMASSEQVPQCQDIKIKLRFRSHSATIKVMAPESNRVNFDNGYRA